jgi:hypothetical protein
VIRGFIPRVFKRDWGNDVLIGFVRDASNGEAEILSFEESPKVIRKERGAYFEDSHALCIDPRMAQLLMDALYKEGFRPTEAKPQDATLSAMKYHLEDMRTLVFKKGEQNNDNR